MGARTGSQFLDGLRHRRPDLWLGNERVDDVTQHPALAGAAAAIADLFDRQHQLADDCLMPDPETDEPINVSHLIPRSCADLKRRRQALLRDAEASVGLLGRTPSYLNVTIAGFAGRHAEWAGEDGGNAAGADNLVRYQRRMALEDLSLTHTIIHPTVDKVRDRETLNPVFLHKVEDTAHGMVVRGARILATLAPFADEIVVYPGVPLPAGDGTAPYAVSFAIPVDTPGLTFLCRDSVSTPESRAFDRPLSTRFDEQDAFVIFDNVEVPRDRIFIDANPAVYNRVMKTAWWPNIMQQTTLRAQTKLEFAHALGARMATAINDTSAPTQEALGEILGYAELTRAAVLCAEELAFDYGDGVWFPDGRPLHPLRALLTEWFPRVAEILTQLGSHNLLATPSRAMLDDGRLRPLIEEFLDGSGTVTAEQRAALFRLAWDFIGSGLAGRDFLYERFYLASAGTNRRNHFLHYNPDRDRMDRLVDRMLAAARPPAQPVRIPDSANGVDKGRARNAASVLTAQRQ
jgi:aromatic ring hydroxylase